MIARVFLHPCVETVMSEHAFAVYPISSQAVGATIRIAPAKGFGHDLDAMRERVGEHTRVVWVANRTTRPALAGARSARGLPGVAAGAGHRGGGRGLCRVRRRARLPGRVAVARQVPQPDRHAHVLEGLWPGGAARRLRLSSPEVADLLNRVRQPFNVNSIALAAALAALGDAEHVRKAVDLNRQGMAQLIDGLRARGLRSIPSVGNFLAIDLGQPAGPIDQHCCARV